MTQNTSDAASVESDTESSKVRLYQLLGQESEGDRGYNMSQKSIDLSMSMKICSLLQE